MNGQPEKDAYLTLKGPSDGLYREKGSKFLAFAFPVTEEDQVMHRLEEVRKAHPKARHHCYAYRLGTEGNRFRTHDDGEPSNTAGRPILGQIDKAGLTDLLVVVARYFGGTLLGTSGLIRAYRSSTADALARAAIQKKYHTDRYAIEFPYDRIGAIMRVVDDFGAEIIRQDFGLTAGIELSFRRSNSTEALVHLRARVAEISLEEARNKEAVEGLRVQLLSRE